MKNRISTLFQSRSSDILSIFYTAGYPNLEDTAPIARYLQSAGADIIEIGIPFSDPVADGPVIQASNKVALENGMTVKKLLDQVRTLRQDVSLPVILMGYLNPVLQYGVSRFCEDAAAAGVDGVILPDMPMEEYEAEYRQAFADHGLLNTFLISPTTSAERIRKIDDATQGFIYAVSASSTTGSRDGFGDEQLEYFARLKAMKLRNKFLVGFGISNRSTFAKASEYGAGAVVGSAFIASLRDAADLSVTVPEFIQRLRTNEHVAKQ